MNTAAFKIIALVVVAALSSASATTQFEQITAGMHSARVHGDWQRFRRGARELTSLLNGSPDALLEGARADARLGATHDALAALRDIANMGESLQVVASLPDFASLRRSRKFRDILTAMNANLVPRSNAARAFTISDAGLLPEDVDYDRASNRFLLTSILEAKIVSSDAKGRLRDFAPSPDRWPMLAIKLDSRRRIVWATEAALGGFHFVPKRDWSRSALAAFDMTTGKLIRRIEAPRPSALGDMAIGPNGRVIVSDGLSGSVYSVTFRCRSRGFLTLLSMRCIGPRPQTTS